MRYAFLFIIPLIFVNCGGQKEEKKEDHLDADFEVIRGRAQGTNFRIKYGAEEPVQGLEEKVNKLLDTVDATFSMYKDSSGVLDLAHAEEGSCIDAKFQEVYGIARKIHEATNGAFDPTVKPLVDAWGFGPDGKPEGEPEGLDSIMELVGMETLELEKRERDGDSCHFLKKSKAGTAFDPNGIAQGYAVDLLAETLKKEGIERAMIQLGGEVRALGKKHPDRGWRIGVEKPQETGEKRSLKAIAEIEDLSMATSGSYRKFYEKDGERYPHTIDPRTGEPVQHRLLSVTVTHPSCTHADAYATAFMIMGEDPATTFVQENEKLEAYFIMSKGDGGFKTFATEGMKEVLKEP